MVIAFKSIEKERGENVLISIAMQALQQFNRMTIKPENEVLLELKQKGLVPLNLSQNQ
jgi:hypothetical protein